MKKLKTFIRTFVKSLTDLKYYQDVAHARFWFAFKYLFFLIFLVSFIGGLFLAVKVIRFIPNLPEFQNKLTSAARNLYPDALILTIVDAKLKTNVKEPYYINFPSEFPGLATDRYQYLIALDTKGESDNFSSYKSVILITDDAVVAPDDSGLRVYPLTENLQKVPNGFFVTKELYLTLLGTLLPYLNYLPYLVYIALALVILVLPLLTASLSTSARLIGLLIMSLLLLLIAKILRKAFTYGQIYKMAMVASTLPILLGLVGSFFPILIPFWATALVLFVFMLVVLIKN